MLRSNETCCLSADDISVRCTVQHLSKSSSSSTSISKKNDGDQNQQNQHQHISEEDMTCTMRVWQKTKQPRTRLIGGVATAAAAALGPKSKHERTPSKTNVETAPGADNDENDHERRRDIEKAGPELILTPNMPAGLLVEQHHHHHQQQQQNLCCGDSFGGGDTPRMRFSSFGSGSFDAPAVRRYSLSTGTQPRTRRIGNVTLLLEDILLIDVNGNSQALLLKKKEYQSLASPEKNSNSHANNDDRRIYIITISNGVYAFTMESTNGRELLVAFLKANLPKERFSDQGISRTPSNGTHDTSHSNRSFDVEAFTAKRMAERLKSESIGEKVQRRVHRLVTSFEELSCAITECTACGCGHAAVSPAPQHGLNVSSTEKMPLTTTVTGSTQDFRHGRHQVVEMAPDETPRPTRPSVAFKDQPTEHILPDRSDTLCNAQLLSGLSVESDTEMD
mmetsp:Transcript_4241/g.10573  ORF Transcript_4241/g.10573 Transcript_4241/m.10573 type:complete len:449 (-) Transcript_4241:315-1661(-)